ncbi:restriction endonuclease subunit S, partial [Escherichia coli]|nr:restriction endonuclease subunit S [Escherichia coli]
MSWRYLKIEDFCSTGSGGTPSRSKPEYYEGGDIPWIKSGDLKDSKIYDANEYITAAGLENSSAKIVEKDSILIAMYGATVGRLAILGINAATNQAICNIRPDTTIADMKYLYYFLKSKFSYFVENAVGGAQPNISQGLIKSLEVPLPPLDEQKRIAAILDKADAIRQKREQAIKLADDFLRATFATMYGNPITNPKKWPVHLMGEIIEFKGGNQPPKSDFIFEPKQGYIRLVQIRDFKSDKYATYIPQEKAKRIFEVDDVMIARYGPPVFQILRGLSGSYNVALMKASPKENIRKGFIFYLLQLPEYHDVVVKNSERTAGQTGVNLELLNKFN